MSPFLPSGNGGYISDLNVFLIIYLTLFLPVMLLGVSGYFLHLQGLEDPLEKQKMFLVVKHYRHSNHEISCKKQMT